MKKFILMLIAMIAIQFSNAQSTTPRYTVKGNSTGGQLSYKSIDVTTTSTMVSVQPNSYYSLVTVATTSLSPTFTTNISTSYKGDLMDLIVASNSTGTRTITLSTNIRANAATTQTLAASKQATFRFVFDGTKWTEVSRAIEP